MNYCITNLRKLLGAGLLALTLSSTSHAAIVITIIDDGVNITMTATGSYDLSSASSIPHEDYIFGAPAGLAPDISLFGWETGTSVNVFGVTTSGALTGSPSHRLTNPTSTSATHPFWTFASSSSGPGDIVFPSSAPLTATGINNVAIFSNITFNQIGMVSGESMTFSWNNDTITVNTGVIPEPSAAAGILGIIALTGGLLRRPRR